MSEQQILAGEYVLRLLDGEELLAARRLLAEDPEFAAAVAEWERRFAGLAEEVPEQQLPPGLWARIEEALGRTADSNVLDLRRRLRRWQLAAGLSASAAVAAAAALLLLPGRAPQPEPSIAERPAPAPVLVAAVATERAGSLAVTYLPERGELVVAPAGLQVGGGRDAELWLIPAGGAPVSLGLVEAGQAGPRPIPAALRAQFIAGATIALSDEPEGGSPTGQPTGAVLGTGALQQG
jgi:anti-sigma-K factor RskA